MTATRLKERIGKAVFAAAAVICVIAVVAIFAFLIYKSIPAFGKLGVFRFMFGDNWSPDRLDTYNSPLSGTYGILTMIVGTLTATVGALLVGGVLGYFTAIFLAFYCPPAPRRVLSAVINLLAGIPSVVYGFFGIVFLLPLLARIAPNNGSGLLATSLILGIMILPTVVSLSRTSLEAVPRSYYEGSVAMGATHSETVFRIMSPAARSGITASLILGIGRALGETMAVVMVAGNAPAYPSGLFSSFRVLTANIVMEMGYAGEVQEGALVATGVILLLFVLAVNLLFGAISSRAVRRISSRQPRGKRPARESRLRGSAARLARRIRDWFGALGSRIRICRIGQGVAVFAGVAVAAVLVLIIGFILVKGLPYLVRNPSLIWGRFEFGGEKVTILPAIITTLYAVGLSLLIAVPVGIMTAVFLNEYARRDNPLIRLIRSAIDILSGVPSIVYGLFGMITFVKLFGGSSSILAGSLTVSMMLLPTISRSTEEVRPGFHAGGQSRAGRRQTAHHFQDRSAQRTAGHPVCRDPVHGTCHQRVGALPVHHGFCHLRGAARRIGQRRVPGGSAVSALRRGLVHERGIRDGGRADPPRADAESSGGACRLPPVPQAERSK